MNEDVVVIGASSAGLFAAYELARQGVPVRVYDQAESASGGPARTLIVTADLNRVLGFVPESAIVNRVERFELRSNGTLARLDLDEPDLIIERSALIRLLAEKAAQAGADLRFGERFAGFETDGDRTMALLQRRGTERTERVAARFVVGADGAHSAVARAIGQPAQPTITVLQARVELPPGADGALSQVWFTPRDTPYFYWLVPESPRSGAIGLVSPSPRDARPKLDNFLHKHGYTPLEYQAALIPTYRPSPDPTGKVGRTSVMMVGDAAGQVKVTTVGGTVSGLNGARAAARAILRESGYRRELLPLNFELTLHWLIRRVWNRFGEEDYSALLHSMNQRVRNILQTRNRDQWAGAIWPVLTARPGLVALAARAAVRAGV